MLAVLLQNRIEFCRVGRDEQGKAHDLVSVEVSGVGYFIYVITVCIGISDGWSVHSEHSFRLAIVNHMRRRPEYDHESVTDR